MKIIKDGSLKYKDPLSKVLVEYNTNQIGPKQRRSLSFYYLNQGHLSGAINTQLSWDWVSIKEIFYETLKDLKVLLNDILKTYGNTCEGVKYYTEDIKRKHDFIKLGFILKGETSPMGHTPKYYYLVLPQDMKKWKDLEVSDKSIIAKEPIKVYHDRLMNEVKAYKKSLEGSEIEQDNEMMYVALIGDEFIGGVHGVYSEESMYIASLAIKPEHRKKGIGYKLMQSMEEEARRHHIKWITLGTADFQALGFYQRLGYTVDLVKENDPKDHKTYSLVKKL